jgi:hypothetical protein
MRGAIMRQIGTTVTTAAAIAVLAGMLGDPAVAGPASAKADGAATAQSRALAAHAQTQPKSKRARTRIRVYRAYPYRLESTPYPTPYPYEYPGPGAVRQCSAQLVPENRPSGTVIVPRTQCWWERG